MRGLPSKTTLKKKELLDSKEAIGIAIQVAQGIAAAHEQHIIHRDIKPQNMIISKDGKVKGSRLWHCQSRFQPDG